MNESFRSHPAAQGCIEALDRCRRIVEMTGDEQFTHRPAGHDSIGAHLRHCIEYVRCLLGGLETGAIDYDARPRDRELETNRNACLEALDELTNRIRSLPPERMEEEVHPQETLSLTCGPRSMRSNVVRELGYLSQHTIHHLAIVALIADLGGFHVPTDLGLACSTALYRRSLESGG